MSDENPTDFTVEFDEETLATIARWERGEYTPEEQAEIDMSKRRGSMPCFPPQQMNTNVF